MKKIILIFLIFFFGEKTYSQDLSELFKYTEKLVQEEKYFDAVTELKRLYFFDSEGIYSSRSEFNLGLSYKKGGFYSEAIRYFTAAEMRTSNPDSLYLIRVEIIKSNILRRTSYRALRLIEALDSISSGENKKSEMNMLKGFALVFADKWEEASGFFRAAGAEDLAELSIDTEDKLYSVTKAKILSAIIPGAGQIYTGEYLNGAISLAWNALTIYWSVEAFRAGRIFDGLMISNFLWLRFYTGGINNAAEFAEQNNLQITNNALKILQNSEYKLN
jgi:tetratricopeptide (TPR) repeat protein